MKGAWKKVVTSVAVVAVAWSLVSPAIILKQQGEISHTASAIAAVQTGNKGILSRLTKDENTVVGFGNYIVASNTWDNVIFLDVCQQFHLQISCTAPPVAP